MQIVGPNDAAHTGIIPAGIIPTEHPRDVKARLKHNVSQITLYPTSAPDRR